MQYRLTTNLGTVDARELNAKYGAKIDLANPEQLKAGSTIELTEEGAEELRKKYPALLEETTAESTARVRGVAKPAAITAPEEFPQNPHKPK